MPPLGTAHEFRLVDLLHRHPVSHGFPCFPGILTARSRGQIEPHVCLAEIRGDSLGKPVACAQFVLCGRVPLTGCLVVPFERQLGVFRDAQSPVVAESQMVLPLGITLQGCFAVPSGCSFVIFSDGPGPLSVLFPESDLRQRISRVFLLLLCTPAEDDRKGDGRETKGSE